MVALHWKARFYAFFLKRLLGPLLKEESLHKLHESMTNISLHQGKFVLTQLQLNPDELTRRIRNKVCVKSCRIDRLDVDIFMDSDLRLVGANVCVDGLVITLVPATAGAEEQQAKELEAAISATKSYLSSVLSTVLSSLKLSVTWNNLQVRLCSLNDDDQEWLELHVGSVTYKDDHATQTAAKDTVVTLRTTTLMVANSLVKTLVARTEGDTKIRVTTGVLLDVQVSVAPALSVSFDEPAFELLTRVLGGFSRQREAKTFCEPVKTTPSTMHDCEADMRTMDGIMKQYHEARLMAQQNYFRGGLLLPNEDVDDKGATFDAFFDANEQSFMHLSAALKESVAEATNNNSANGDFVHTKLRLFLPKGSFKLVFTNYSQSLDSEHRRRANEYVLLSFYELHMCSSLSQNKDDYSLTINHFGVEDSQVECNPVSESVVGRNAEIGSLLRFFRDNDGDECLVVNAPCLTISASKDKTDGVSAEVEITLDPFEVTYRESTMLNLSTFFRKDSATEDDLLTNDTGLKMRLSMFAACPSITLWFPVLVENDVSCIYRRCGYEQQGGWTSKSALGVAIEEISFQSSTVAAEPAFSLSTDHIVVFATSPAAFPGSKSRRFDFLCLSGRTEVKPSIPVEVKLWRVRSARSQGDDAEGVAIASFPKVPTISSFRAREEDEDEDCRIDRVLSSKFTGVDIGSRRDLRGHDPQAEMLLDASKSDHVFEMYVPEICCDLSTHELSSLSRMLECLTTFSKGAGKSSTTSANKQAETASTVLSFAIRFDIVSFAIHTDDPLPESKESLATFVIDLDDIKVHLLQNSIGLRHVRFLAREIVLYEGKFVLFMCHATPLRLDERILTIILSCCSYGVFGDNKKRR
jgi:hypothetical protein